MLRRGLVIKQLRSRLLERQFLQYGTYFARIPRENIIARANLVLLMKRHHGSKNSKTINDQLNAKGNVNANAKIESSTKTADKKELQAGEDDVENVKSKKICKKKDCEPTNETTQSTSTRTLEIQTTKGILSVTTTIEDSKINDVIFEKTSSAPSSSNAQDAKNESTSQTKNNNAKKNNNADKDKGTALNLKKTATESMKKVVAAFIKPSATKATTTTTMATDAMNKGKVEKVDGDKAATTANETHALEKNIKKKPVKVAVRAMEKLAAVAAAATNVKSTATMTTTPTPTTNSTAAPPKVETPVPPRPAKPARVLVDFNRSSLERNFITPGRAMSDFLLKATDLENLPKIKRRSPYEQEPPMTVFWRRDVESKAIEVWGSRENLLKEQLKRDVERKKHQQNIFTVKRRLRDYRREIGQRTHMLKDNEGLSGQSGKVVLIAVGINGVNFLFKVIGWLYTGSHSMFAECIHSLADTINQLILAYGIHKSQQHADPDHPYGYSNWKYVSSLISGVGIFCVGTGLSIYHGITGLMNPTPLDDLFWALLILGGSFVSEGATLIVAMNEVRRSAAIKKISFKEYVISGRDPCVNVVLMEDAAAVSSVGVAVTCMSLSSITGNPTFDAVGSLIVGGILGGVASFIIYTNTAALVGRSIDLEHLERINSELESDIMIRAIHDVKGIDMGNSLVRYKAEMDFDGRELTRSYLDKQDLTELLKIVKSFQTVEELEKFLLNHGENIVDLMGGEIDRIEMKLRKKFPEIRHCDLEIL